MWRLTAPGGLLFVRDLHRPKSAIDVDALVTKHLASAPPEAHPDASFAEMRRLFRASLEASLTVNEIADIVAPLGIERSSIRMTSDRHWTLACEKP